MYGFGSIHVEIHGLSSIHLCIINRHVVLVHLRRTTYPTFFRPATPAPFTDRSVGWARQVSQGNKLKDRLAKKRKDRESQLVLEEADAEAVKVLIARLLS